MARLPPMSCMGDTRMASVDAPITTRVPRVPRPSTAVLIVSGLVTVARMVRAPPSSVSALPGSSAVLSM
jgi:hypothetical protein